MFSMKVLFKAYISNSLRTDQHEKMYSPLLLVCKCAWVIAEYKDYINGKYSHGCLSFSRHGIMRDKVKSVRKIIYFSSNFSDAHRIKKAKLSRIGRALFFFSSC